MEKNIINNKDVYALEFSQYLHEKNGYPFMLDNISSTIKKNVHDMYHNERGNNKWQLVFIGSYEECVEAMGVFYSNIKTK